MPTYKTTGIILRRTDYGETDRIYSILNIDGLIIEAIAKGVRKPQAKLSAHLELFAIIELMFARGKNLDVITSARTIKSFERIGENYERMRLGFLICEMLAKLAAQNTNPAHFQLTEESFSYLSQGAAPALAEIYFKLRLLGLLGYRPELERDVYSKEATQDGQDYAFSSEGGGLIAKAQVAGDSSLLTADQIKLWRLVYRYPLKELSKVKQAAQEAQASLPVLNDFYLHIFGKRFKSEEI